VSEALTALDVVTSKDDVSLRTQLAYGMFDTRGNVGAGLALGAAAATPPCNACVAHCVVAAACTRAQVDPFDKDSPIKQTAIEKFPPDMFFVLRVVQLLRGMATGERRGAWALSLVARRVCCRRPQPPLLQAKTGTCL
jgi:hypothetical protein